MIKKILIANRGEIAVRIIKTCKLLNIKTVAIYSLSDKNSLHIKLADESICTGNDDGYTNINNIIQAAINTNCDAIHPGYGFLSEEYNFASAVEKSSITFIGPTSNVIEITTDKKKAKSLCKNLGINVVEEFPYNENCEYKFPILVKDNFGAGGKGINKISDANQLQEFISNSNFNNEKTLVIEKYVEVFRHIEIQFARDKFNNSIIFPERDCTIQDNFKKIIESTPAINISKEIKEKLKRETLKIIDNLDYVGVGTAEFIIDKNNRSYFVEINPRIQVEHPITEEYANTDLVELQIKIANSEEIFNDKNSFDDKNIDKYVIEARIYAKNGPKKIVENFEYVAKENLRIDTCIYKGMEINFDYDTLLLKAICGGKNRNEAVNQLIDALSCIDIAGINTNKDEIINFLQTENFLGNKYDIHIFEDYKQLMRKSKLSANERIKIICDSNSFEELNLNNNSEIVSGIAKINDIKVAICTMDASYKAGSVSKDAIDKIVKTIYFAKDNKLPLIVVSASGGIKITEGVRALVGMSKIALAINEYKKDGLLYISYITNPTYGGIYASISTLGDIIIAEENSMIGFSGKKVIEKEFDEILPKNFQTADFCFENGLIDIISNRYNCKRSISRILEQYNRNIEKNNDLKQDSKTIQLNKIELLNNVRANVHIRPRAIFDELFSDAIEIHGDRLKADDKAVKCLLAKIDNDYVSVVYTDKTNNLNENIENNFGMIKPEGYRKIKRFFKLSEKLSSPIVIFVDTPGADPTCYSEMNGQSNAIADVLEEISEIKVPIVSFITGEANSGGAIAITTSDYLAMFSSAVFSVISPEAYRDIVYESDIQIEDFINELRISAKEMIEDKIVDEIIDDTNFKSLINNLKKIIKNKIYKLSLLPKNQLIKNRKEKIRRWGE